MLFFPRRIRIICFFIVTVWQIGVILTANYTFLNYLVLALAIFLLDDHFLNRFVPQSWKSQLFPAAEPVPRQNTVAETSDIPASPISDWQNTWPDPVATVRLALTALML